MEEETLKVESVRYQPTGFDAITIPDEQPSINKKAAKAQLKHAKAAFKSHIEALSGNSLKKAYLSNCKARVYTDDEKRRAVFRIFDEIPTDEINRLFDSHVNLYKESTMRRSLNGTFKDKEATDIWHFIAENPLPKKKKEKKTEEKKTEEKTEEKNENQ